MRRDFWLRNCRAVADIEMKYSFLEVHAKWGGVIRKPYVHLLVLQTLGGPAKKQVPFHRQRMHENQGFKWWVQKFHARRSVEPSFLTAELLIGSYDPGSGICEPILVVILVAFS